MGSSRLILGTRGSDLALAQAHATQKALGGVDAVEIRILRTQGDKLLEVDLSTRLDKGFFTSELEKALSDGEVDLAVHSLKDLPTQQPPGLVLAGVPRRAPVGDVLLALPEVVEEGSQDRLPLVSGTVVGTASPRRVALAHRFGHTAALLRGNVPTRVNRCREGTHQAIVLARAGLSRLALDPAPLVAYDLDPQVWIPAAAQGALGLQCRADDEAVISRLALLADRSATDAVTVERGLLRRVEAGCHAPFGALAQVDDEGVVQLCAGWDQGDGWRWASLSGSIDELEPLYGRWQESLAEGGAVRPLWSPAAPWWGSPS